MNLRRHRFRTNDRCDVWPGHHRRRLNRRSTQGSDREQDAVESSLHGFNLITAYVNANAAFLSRRSRRNGVRTYLPAFRSRLLPQSSAASQLVCNVRNVMGIVFAYRLVGDSDATRMRFAVHRAFAGHPLHSEKILLAVDSLSHPIGPNQHRE